MPHFHFAAAVSHTTRDAGTYLLGQRPDPVDIRQLIIDARSNVITRLLVPYRC